MSTILLAAEEPAVAAALEAELRRAGHDVIVARSRGDVAAAVSERPLDLVIAEARSAQLPAALDLLTQLRREGRDAAVIVLAGRSAAEHAIAAIHSGAAATIAKPVQPELLSIAVDQSLAYARMRRELAALRREVTSTRHERQVVAESPAMRRTMQAVAMAAPTRAAVLLHGEPGSGRSLLARALHDGSDRCEGPFVSINCGGLPERVLESMLFGNESDPFTGAPVRLEGAVERAHGGTLVLDGVDDLPAGLEERVLRLLQRQEFARVGGETQRVNVRLLATARRDPALPANGKPRTDLLARLTTMAIAVPPLRERGADIPMLAHRLATRAAGELGRRFERFSSEALQAMRSARWPGNVRELRDVIERALVTGDDPVIQLDRVLAQLPHAELPTLPPGRESGTNGGLPADAVVLTTLNVDQAERALIEKALALTNQNRTRTAALLGISVRTLRNKLNGPHRHADRAREG